MMAKSGCHQDFARGRSMFSSRVRVRRLPEAVAAGVLFLVAAASAQDIGTASEDVLETAYAERPYSPYAGGAVPNRVFWGDTHLHTSYSMDAGAFGNRLDPEAAYRFARGDEVESTTAGRVRLARPLDVLVVADHSDNMGFFTDLFSGDPAIQAEPKQVGIIVGPTRLHGSAEPL